MIIKIVLALSLLVFYLSSNSPANAQNINLLKNSDFEQEDRLNNIPQYWTKDYWQADSKIGITSEKARHGKYAVLLKSDIANDIRVIQTVKVKPNKLYRFSGWVATKNVSGGNIGANLSVMGGFVHSTGVSGSHDWQPIEVLFKTTNQTQVILAARLGHYSNTASGAAFFDDLLLEEVKDQKVVYQTLDTKQPGNIDKPVSSNPLSKLMSNLFSYPALILFFYLLLLYGLRLKLGRFEVLAGSTKEIETRLPIYFFGLAIIAVLVRIPLIEGTPFAIDVNDFKAWALRIIASGPANFYAPDYFCDYPPFAVYILGIVGWISKSFSLTGNHYWFTFLIKLPSLICDIATAWLILTLIRKKNPLVSLLLSGVYMMLPVVIYNSAYWGQMDSCYAFMMLLTFYLAAVRKQPEFAAVLVTASFLTKAQTIAFIPLLLFYLFQKYDWRRILRTILVALIAGVIIILPFNMGKPLTWIFDFYRSQANLYPYASFYAANFLTLLGGHAIKDNNLIFGPVSYYYLGIFIFLTTTAWSCYYYHRKRTNDALALTMAIVAFAFFLFFPRMHERYLFPAFAFLLTAIGYYKDRKLYLIAVLLSLTGLLNLQLVVLKFQNLLTDNIFNEALLILSMINTGLFIALIAIFQMQSGRTGRKIKEFISRYHCMMVQSLSEKFKEKPFQLKKADYLLLGLLVLVYTGFIFFRLGSGRMPQTGLYLDNSPKGIEISFAAGVVPKTMVIYDCEGSGALEVGQSNGTDWQPVATAKLNDFYVLKRIPLNLFKAANLKLSPQPTTGRINEIAFLDSSGRLVPVKSVHFLDNNREVPAAETQLFDEQGLMTAKPSYLTSTYFDEIYHGRTAYEFVKGLPVYETTHPPLGKALLSLGIRLFGMNPFGMRSMHAIAGILLMILLFLLGRQILGSRFGAYSVMILGMLDFMPFVQSRYSTIDTFSVLTINLILLFTFKYIREQESRANPGSSRQTLSLIFISFALAVSAKWTAIYALAGVLFIIFIIKLRQLVIFLREKSKLKIGKAATVNFRQATAGYEESQPKGLAGLNQLFWHKNILPTVITILVLLFLVTPLIYYLSYIPFLKSSGVQEIFSARGVGAVINNQKWMYSYHSNLTATHPFSSPWWCWPFNFKPLWLYSGPEVAAADKATIVTMGNPLIWWLGLVALLVIGYQLLRARRLSIMHFGFICFLASYLPWVLVNRVTFIYHYYTMLPLLYVFIAFMLENCWRHSVQGRKIVYGILAVGLGLLILFYPALSGMEVSQKYIEFLRWFPKEWYF